MCTYFFHNFLRHLAMCGWIRVQTWPFFCSVHIFWPLTFIYHLKVYPTSVLGQSSGLIVILNQAMHQWLWIELLNRLRKNQRPIFFMWPSRTLASHLSVTYLTLVCFTTQLVNLINSIEVILNYSRYIHCLIAWFPSKL